MAIVALLAWTVTVAAGVYLLLTSTRPAASEPPAAQRQPVPAGFASEPAGSEPANSEPAGTAADPKTAERTRFDPPSLARAKAEPIPGGRALAEFAHPLLGMTGFGIFLGYLLSRAWILGVIALGIGVGAVAAGLCWAVVNARAARQDPPDRHAMSFSPRLLLLHGAGASLTIVLAALIAAHV